MTTLPPVVNCRKELQVLSDPVQNPKILLILIRFQRKAAGRARKGAMRSLHYSSVGRFCRIPSRGVDPFPHSQVAARPLSLEGTYGESSACTHRRRPSCLRRSDRLAPPGGG